MASLGAMDLLLFACNYRLSNTDNRHWLLSRVQGCGLEPKWQWPSWDSAALHDLNHVSTLMVGYLGVVGVDIPSEHNRPLASLLQPPVEWWFVDESAMITLRLINCYFLTRLFWATSLSQIPGPDGIINLTADTLDSNL